MTLIDYQKVYFHHFLYLIYFYIENGEKIYILIGSIFIT